MAMAILIGALTAIGWWSGGKVTSAIDNAFKANAPACETKIEQKVE